MGCEKQPLNLPEEKILVRINNRITIGLNEFLRRAEYTVRPAYCKNNSYLDKKIILNSLIAEKLLALEAGDNNLLLKNEEFLAFLKGQKEQAMRQWMHQHQAVEKVKLDSSEIKKYYRFAGREYTVDYFYTKDKALVEQATADWKKHNNYFQYLYQTATGDTIIPRRKVSWGKQENVKILASLFSADHKIGEVLGPIDLAKNEYLYLKIVGWDDTKAITQPQIQQRLDHVQQELTRIKVSQIWNDRVSDIMRGKTIDFVEDTFEKLNKIFFDIYFRTDEEISQSIKEEIWDVETKQQNNLEKKIPGDMLQLPFFTIDKKIWTVEDFRKELMSHPLVFRERKMASNEFAEQFRLAVVDLVRDHYVTQEAYRQGYDRLNAVQHTEQMWRDTFLAVYQKHLYLQTIAEKRNFAKNYLRIIDEHLNSYVDSLQQKFYKKIELDFDAFEKIALTNIDMFTKQPSQPYPNIVPLFPVITTDDRIEYLTRMKKR